MRKARSISRKTAMMGALALSAFTLTGCNSAGEGLFSGALVGAAAGTALGSLDGNAGEGALYGAIIGGLGGAILGDQNERNANGGYTRRQHRTGHYGHDHHSNRHRGHHGGYNDPWWDDDCDDW